MLRTDNKPREYTKDEILYMFLKQLKGIRDYWATAQVTDDTIKGRLDGLCFSTLVLMDGYSGGFEPSLELVPTVHPTNKETHKDYSENWFPDQQAEQLEEAGIMSINDGEMLHDLWHAFCRGEVDLIDGKMRINQNNKKGIDGTE